MNVVFGMQLFCLSQFVNGRELVGDVIFGLRMDFLSLQLWRVIFAYGLRLGVEFK
jgi:hypothetical protein